MADEIKKLLAKLPKHELIVARFLMNKVQTNDLDGLDAKPLKGQKSIFRVRKGKIRVIYRQTGSVLKIIGVKRRDEKTYKGF